MPRLDHKIAIITGGARGIGRATVEKFLAEGAAVAIWDIQPEVGKTLLQALAQPPEKLRFYTVDIADAVQVQKTVDQVLTDFGGIDILVNNAGITRDATLAKMSSQQWQSVIDVNLSGVFHCTKAVTPHLIERGGGRILSAASVVAHYGNFGQSNYVAAKAGVIGMTKVWARELGKHGITANAIAPGFIRTEMVQTVPDHIIAQVEGKTPLRRMGNPADIANAYAFLASEEAAFISGAVLNVDGGLVM